jgi:ADP-ribose pyrophosphatase
VDIWKRVSSTYIVADPWLRLRADTCRTSRGVIVEPYYVIEAPNFVNAVALTDNHDILFVRQYRHPVGRVVTELPGGLQEDMDGSPEAAIRRELLEETGYTHSQMVFLDSFEVNPARFSNRVYSYLALDPCQTGPVQSDETEDLEIECMPLVEAVRRFDSGDLDLQPLHLVALHRALAWIKSNNPELLNGV